MSNHITEIETQNVVANSKAIIVIHGDKLDRKVKIIDYHIDIIFFFFLTNNIYYCVHKFARFYKRRFFLLGVNYMNFCLKQPMFTLLVIVESIT
jgi:hypothetical protein